MENNYEVNIVSLEMEASAESQSESSSLSNSLESRGDDADSNLGEWTNERHSSYLDSLENSFVRQLYSLLGREETRSVSRTRYVQSDSHKSTDQVRNGCRHKVNFGKKRAYLEMSSEYTIGNAADQGNVLRKEEIEISGDKAFTRNSMGHEYPARCNAEASGQNFREVGERGVTRKRRREASHEESSLNDQVVP